VAEIPSTRLRIKTVVISRTLYNLAGIVIGLLQPRFMNPTAWNWGAKTSLFWAGFNLMGLIWTFFRLPEPRGYVTYISSLIYHFPYYCSLLDANRLAYPVSHTLI